MPDLGDCFIVNSHYAQRFFIFNSYYTMVRGTITVNLFFLSIVTRCIPQFFRSSPTLREWRIMSYNLRTWQALISVQWNDYLTLLGRWLAITRPHNNFNVFFFFFSFQMKTNVNTDRAMCLRIVLTLWAVFPVRVSPDTMETVSTVKVSFLKIHLSFKKT